MSIRLRIEVCKKEGTDHYGSIGATCGLELEIDQSVLADPAAAVARIRGYYSFCETAMHEELARLRNGNATTPASDTATVAAPPENRPVARTPTAPPRPVAERAEEDDDDNPPPDGRCLLGWAKSQPDDAKNWLVGLGKRLRYPPRIIDWTPKQVQTAYQAYREAQRG
jgi:hypothetical protein